MSQLDGDALDGTTAARYGTAIDGNTASQHQLWGRLPRQSQFLGPSFSVARDWQLRELLGVALNGAVGCGVITGGHVVAGTGARDVIIQAGLRLFCGGVLMRLTQDATFNGNAADGPTTLWASILRVAKDPALPAQIDTYTFDFLAGATRPFPGYVPLAISHCTAGSLVSIETEPNGKYLRKRSVDVITTLAVGSTGTVAYDHSAAFTRYEVGHTRVRAIDQDNVTASVLPETVTETGFSLSLVSAGAPTVDTYGGPTDLKITVDLWGGFYDLA